MKPSTRDEINGKFHDLKGKGKEKAGQLTSDPDLEAEGQTEMIAGKVRLLVWGLCERRVLRNCRSANRGVGNS